VKSSSTSTEGLLAKVMLWGVLLSAVIMLGGGVVYLVHHGGEPTRDHVFTGEPRELRSPVAIVRSAFTWNNQSIIQFGVLLLLANPLLRVILALISFGRRGDPTYIAVSLFLVAILTYSLFA